MLAVYLRFSPNCPNRFFNRFQSSGYNVLKTSRKTRTAAYLHRVLDVPLLILLLIHVVIEVKFSFMQWGFKNQRLLNLIMLVLGTICLVLILYVDAFQFKCSMWTCMLFEARGESNLYSSLFFCFVSTIARLARLSLPKLCKNGDLR